VLEVEDLTVTYGPVRALHSVSMAIPDRSITAIIGANGAGKSTLLRTISGVVHPRTGRVTYDGEDLTRMPVEGIVRLGIVQVPEGRGVIQELTVEENLRLGALWRRDGADRRRALAETYELFPPLAARRGKVAVTLSGGERQMLVIGRALMARPRVLLLDEPSLGLAPMVTASIMALLRDLSVERGLTILLVEQNARSALSIAEHGVVLSLGEVVVTQSARELAEDSELRHHYLGF
jgi:branched-chain amino acid transport system ATP-binding protein